MTDRANTRRQRTLSSGRNGPEATIPSPWPAKRFASEKAAGSAKLRTAAEEAVRLGPHLWEAHFALGYVTEELAAQGFLPPGPTRDQAIASMRKALELSPRQAEVWYWFGLALLHTGNADHRKEALRAVGRSIALEPAQRQSLHRLRHGTPGPGGCSRRSRRFPESPRPKGFSALILYVDAAQAARRRDYSTAFRLESELIQGGQPWPSHLGNWLALGFQLRRDAEIRDRFDRWYRDNSEYPEVYALKAQLKARDGDYAGAAAEDQAGLKIAPFNRKLRMQKAVHLQARRDWAGAMKAADAVLEVSANDYAAQTIRARSLAELGRGADAKALLDALQKDFPVRSKEIDDLRRTLAGRLPK